MKVDAHRQGEGREEARGLVSMLQLGIMLDALSISIVVYALLVEGYRAVGFLSLVKDYRKLLLTDLVLRGQSRYVHDGQVGQSASQSSIDLSEASPRCRLAFSSFSVHSVGCLSPDCLSRKIGQSCARGSLTRACRNQRS